MYESKIEKIDQMIEMLKSQKKNMQRMDKIRLKECSTPKQFGKREADMNWLAMDNIKITHSIHALAVDLGYADERESYGCIELESDGWHKYKFELPTPESYKNRIKSGG